jgi:hypothetical protein
MQCWAFLCHRSDQAYAHLASDQLRKALDAIEGRSHSGHTDLQGPETPILKES